MISCVAFIFFTLVELVIVSQLAQRDHRREMGARICQKWLDMVRKKKPKLQPGSRRLQACKVDAVGESTVIHNGMATNDNANVPGWMKLKLHVVGTQSAPVLQQQQLQVQSTSPTAVKRETDLLLPKVDEPNIVINAPKSNNINNNKYAFFDRFTKSAQNSWNRWKKFTVTAVMVDQASLFVFPASFIIFNAIYWSVYFFALK